MKSPHILKAALRPVLRSALWGAVLFVALTVAPPICLRYFGEGKSLEQWWPGLFFTLCLVVALPAIFLERALGLEGTAIASAINKYPVALVVNAVLGALVFGIIRLGWEIVTKENHDA
jgi:hypothetical protein